MSTHEEDQPSRVGKFIQTYHSFLSTFVIGAAGLVATSMWQFRQAETAARQAESQARIATVQAENSWRIERAEILSKNLNVLSSTGTDTVEQRYGVLLSLTRGNILDTELAVSYALELGKDSPAYMESVLAATPDKSYARLASAFELSCHQRFGTTRDLPFCLAQNRIERSAALTDLFADETEAALQHARPGPTELLRDERAVLSMPLRLCALFGQYLSELHERRQLQEIKRFEELSTGAHLISALLLSANQNGAFVAASEAHEVDGFRKQHAAWLRSYLFGASCNAECKAKLVEIMLSWYDEAEGRFDDAFRELFARPRIEVGMALSRLHVRLLSCQLDAQDGVAFRDQLLVPLLTETAKQAKSTDTTLLEDLLALLALAPDPALTTDAQAQPTREAWNAALAAARSSHPEVYDRAFTRGRTQAQATRKNPPTKLKRGMFCSAEQIELADAAIDDE